MAEANNTALQSSSIEESRQQTKGGGNIPSGSNHDVESDDAEPDSMSLHASFDEISESIHHHPLNNDDSGTFGVSEILEQVLLFGCGLGSSLCYIATLSSLVYFMLLYGPASYVDLNLAIYLPLLPISFAQAKWDGYLDHVYQSRRTFLFRGLVAFGLSLWGTVGMASTSLGLGVVIWNAVLQGTGGAILYGTLNQLASFLGVTDKERRRAKATVSAGVQASALVVLLVSILSGFGSHNSERYITFVWIIVAIEAVCFLMFLWLMMKQPRVAASLLRRDSSLELSLHGLEETSENDERDGLITEPLLAVSSGRSSEGTNGTSRELKYVDLWHLTKSCIYVLVATLIPSFLVGSWFTNVKTHWMRLPQILFYTRIAADFVGRLVTMAVPPRGIRCLVYGSMIRLVPVFFFFALGEGNDILFIVLVAVIAFLSGYLVTGCFQLAPQCIPEELKSYNLAKQASLLTVAFSVAAVGGLCASFALMKIGI